MPPSALERMSEIAARAAGVRPAVFLDYDGTLSPIVERPEDADLSATMRAKIAHLAARCPVAIVSGRDLADVRRRVGLEQLIYVGSHGFDIAGPNGLRQVLPEAELAAAALDAAERELRAVLGPIAGAQVERKRFSIAAHYRRVRADEVGAVERAVDAALHAHHGLRKRGGKKVLELQPDVAWDKGAAVLWLLQTLGLDGGAALPLYIGDDLTDEDAFRVIDKPGVGIVVLDEPRETAASYSLRDPNQVGDFLDTLAAALESHRPHSGRAPLS